MGSSPITLANFKSLTPLTDREGGGKDEKSVSELLVVDVSESDSQSTIMVEE